MSQQQIGKVVGLWRYPVKSMHAEALSSAKIWWHGLEGDRRYAFVQARSRSQFPWLTGRELPALLQYRPHFELPDQPAQSALRVTNPAGRQYAIDDPALSEELERLSGEPLNLLHLGRGAYDSSAGISLLSTNTLQTFTQLLGEAPAAERFRVNMIIETAGDASYPEDDWIGAALQFGDREDSARVRVIRPIKRCMMITLDPETSAKNPAILRAVAQNHQDNAGVYAVPEQTGTITLGDIVYRHV